MKGNLVFAGALVTSIATFQPLTLVEVLFRANEYVVQYEKAFSAVVSEERYAQRVIGRRGEEKRARTLVSDFLIVRAGHDAMWIGFRDVREIDGKPVGDRQARLEKLFLESPEIAFSQARKIADEGARFNLGDIQRNFNVPTLALLVLHPLNQHRFNFERIGEESVEDVPTWSVSFSERARPTLIRSERGDLFTRGRLWIDPANGRVVRSEMIAGDLNTSVRSRIIVSYRPEPKLGLWVPAEMRETYERPRAPGADTIEGASVYTNFRRFSVSVHETVGPPRKPPH